MTITASKGWVDIRITLYGQVTTERAEAEQRIAERRADQLHVGPLRSVTADV